MPFSAQTENYGFLNFKKHLTLHEMREILSKDQKWLEILQTASDSANTSHILDQALSLSTFDNIVFVGIGGSIFSARAMCALSSSSVKAKIYFMDNFHRNGVEEIISRVNLEKTAFIFVSKSGGTIETLVQMCSIISCLHECGLGKFISNSCTTVIGDMNSPMALISKKYNIPIIPWSGTISGRFSAFSNNSNLMSAVCGVDIINTNAHFIEFTEKFLSSNDFEKKVNYSISAIDSKIANNIWLCYDNRLAAFLDWYVQIWAESIGKNGIGSTPCQAICPVDQHSKLQLYLDGPKDKVFTVIGDNSSISYQNIIDFNLFTDCNIEYLKNVNDSKVISAAMLGTCDSLEKKNLPVRKIFGKIDINFLVKLMTFATLETVICCHYFGINPYNQPAVEDSKVDLYKNLQKINKIKSET